MTQGLGCFPCLSIGGVGELLAKKCKVLHSANRDAMNINESLPAHNPLISVNQNLKEYRRLYKTCP